MAIELKSVEYSYDQGRKKHSYALKDINVSINDKDEFISIIGKTGSGKSSLVNIFNALRIPTSGEAFLYGIKLKERRKRKENYNKLREKIGLVFQFPDYQLFEESVIKDVMFGPKNFGHKEIEAKEMAIKALELVSFPKDSYEKSPFELSGGEKKMASIAGILASDPDIFILDEPTASLDPKLKKQLFSLLLSLNRDQHKTIIVITHDMNVVYEYSKRALVLNEGTLIYDGDPEELFTSRSDVVEKASLDYPDLIEITKELNDKCNLDLPYKKNIDELLEEIIK